MSRVPTENQAQLLRVLANGCTLMRATRREVEPLLRRDWVTAEGYEPDTAYPYSFVRITSDGLRALADATDRYGRPRIPNGRGPRNTLIRRASGEVVVRPFRGLRRDQAAAEEAAPLKKAGGH